MKKILKIFIPLLILGALTYQFRSVLFNTQFLPAWDNLKNDLQIFFTNVPCVEPIPYTLGTFDLKFNISQKYFLSAFTEAEAVWEKPMGKNLFSYTPEDSSNDVLKINLIYDYRQQATSKLAELGIIAKDDRASYDMLKAKFTALKAEFIKVESNYNNHVQNFNDRQKTYEKLVEYWNAQGEAPRREYDKLQTEKSALDAQSSQLEAEKMQIDETINEINALVVVLNRLVITLNLSVEKYNTINVARGESFEEGMYFSNGIIREINIYEFSSRAKLVRVLAHEFGHALDLDHVADPKAIMYKLNQSSNLTLTKVDLLALETRCGVK